MPDGSEFHTVGAATLTPWEAKVVTCDMGSHNVTCHPTQVNVPTLNTARHLCDETGLLHPRILVPKIYFPTS